jgi:hypothetical protein
VLSQAAALALTCLVEAPVVVALLRWRQQTHPASLLRWVMAGTLPSLLTHPVAWRTMGRFGAHDYAQGLAWVEAAVVLAEALLITVLAPCTARRALGASLAANGASALAGWLLWPAL